MDLQPLFTLFKFYGPKELGQKTLDESLCLGAIEFSWQNSF